MRNFKKNVTTIYGKLTMHDFSGNYGKTSEFLEMLRNFHEKSKKFWKDRH